MVLVGCAFPKKFIPHSHFQVEDSLCPKIKNKKSPKNHHGGMVM